MDNLVFEESLNSEIEHSEFINKKWIYVNDNNNGNYTSQVVQDSTPLSNSGGWINWSEGFILMPLVVQLTAATAANLPVDSNNADYSWAIKNGFHQMINSATIEFNNQNVNNLSLDTFYNNKLIDNNINCNNTKRNNLNFSNYLNPSKMSNNGFGNINNYTNLYPEQTRKIENNRENNLDRFNYDNNLIFNNYNINDEYFRGGFDSRIHNKKTIN